MMDKKLARLRRAKRTRLNIRESGQIRLSVHRTPRHIYAQITSAAGDRVLVTASTVEKDLRDAATEHRARIVVELVIAALQQRLERA